MLIINTGDLPDFSTYFNAALARICHFENFAICDKSVNELKNKYYQMASFSEYIRNVLIAEDDDDDFYIFSKAIEELSIPIILSRAENGEILIKLLNEKYPDMLFLDILMPCKDGRQCLKEIRSDRRYDDLPIII